MTITCANDGLNCIRKTKQNNTLLEQRCVVIVGMKQMLRLLMSNEKRWEQMDSKQRMSHIVNNCMSILRYEFLQWIQNDPFHSSKVSTCTRRTQKSSGHYLKTREVTEATKRRTYFKYSSLHARSPEFVARTIIIDTSLRHLLNEVGINCTVSNRVVHTKEMGDQMNFVYTPPAVVCVCLFVCSSSYSRDFKVCLCKCACLYVRFVELFMHKIRLELSKHTTIVTKLNSDVSLLLIVVVSVRFTVYFCNFFFQKYSTQFMWLDVMCFNMWLTHFLLVFFLF